MEILKGIFWMVTSNTTGQGSNEPLDLVRLREMTNQAGEQQKKKAADEKMLHLAKLAQEEEESIAKYAKEIGTALDRIPTNKFYEAAESGRSSLKITTLTDPSVRKNYVEDNACKQVRAALGRVSSKGDLVLIADPIYQWNGFFDEVTDKCEVFAEW